MGGGQLQETTVTEGFSRKLSPHLVELQSTDGNSLRITVVILISQIFPEGKSLYQRWEDFFFTRRGGCYEVRMSQLKLVQITYKLF
jgi:hypothetical protein